MVNQSQRPCIPLHCLYIYIYIYIYIYRERERERERERKEMNPPGQLITEATLKLQLLHNTKRPTKWSGHVKMIDPPPENFYIRKTFYPRG